MNKTGEKMNNINSINYSPRFQGLKVDGVVRAQDAKKLGEFASKFENINFIKDVEKTLQTDVILDDKITKIGFSHQKYGNLSKHGCGSYQLENVFRDVMTIISDIKSAIKKAEKEYEKELKAKEAVKRGC